MAVWTQISRAVIRTPCMDPRLRTGPILRGSDGRPRCGRPHHESHVVEVRWREVVAVSDFALGPCEVLGAEGLEVVVPDLVEVDRRYSAPPEGGVSPGPGAVMVAASEPSGGLELSLDRDRRLHGRGEARACTSVTSPYSSPSISSWSRRSALRDEPLAAHAEGALDPLDDAVEVAYDVVLPGADHRPAHATQLCMVLAVARPGCARSSLASTASTCRPIWESGIRARSRLR